MENVIETIKKEAREAFKETYVILNKLDLYKKIPKEVKKIIEDNLDNTYNFTFDTSYPLFEQVDNTITRNLLTYIYTNYINNNNKYIEKEIKDIINQS